ncbi:MAG: glycosyltransferase family 9 protein [Firmicutes bacterium]|nr:glycosyltransferase family 9 protein [Bacillota bacterium]
MLDNVQNILMIRRGAIGDILFTLPAYHLLRANFPNSKISFLVKDSYSQVLQGFPGLDEKLFIRKKDLSSSNIVTLWNMSRELFKTVQSHNFQLAIDFVGHGEQAFFLWLANIQHRWGSIKTRKPLRQYFYSNYFIRNMDTVHIIDQHLKLLERGGLTSFPVKNEYVVPKENLEKAEYIFKHLGLSLNQPTLYIQPFTGDGVAGKMWPLDRYVSVADYCQRQGMQVLFGGAPDEREKLTAVAERFPVAAGQADLVTSIALAKLSSVIVGGDTGLMHAAVAVGKRTVMLVGPTNYFRIGPYQHPEWAIRPPSGNVIEDISVTQVIEGIITAINEL